MYKNAIVRTPGKSMVDGITTSSLGKPDYAKALKQHHAYIMALEECGLEVVVLAPLEDYPDSTFVEDVALITPRCAIITNPGAPSRKGETVHIHQILNEFYENIESIPAPGTVEGGDIMKVGSHYFIGISERTNYEGARQLIAILEKYDLGGSTIQLEEYLHLKTGVAYLENRVMVACGELLDQPDLESFTILPIPEEESYAANCIWINGTVLVAQGFPQTSRIVQDAGYPILELDVSEFQKLDGGLSCLSLRF